MDDDASQINCPDATRLAIIIKNKGDVMKTLQHELWAYT